ncbi:MAG TPA: type IV pilus biogenesis/stability protein PilW [Rhodocyclaceae bacterium]
MRVLVSSLVVLLIAGCATTGTGVSTTTAEQAVSQQATTSETQQRAKVHTELGALYLEAGRFGVAQDEARIAIGAEPSYAPAYNLLALVLMNLRENAAADEEFRRALRLAPNDPEINNNYGWFLCQTERVKESVPHFMAAIKNPLYTTPAKAMTALGLCYLKLQDETAAEDFLAKAVRVDPASNEAKYWLADIYYRKGRYSEARRLVGEVNKAVEPTAETTWLALRIERKIGDREGEARYAAQMRRKFQGSPEYQKLMQGQYE